MYTGGRGGVVRLPVQKLCSEYAGIFIFFVFVYL